MRFHLSQLLSALLLLPYGASGAPAEAPGDTFTLVQVRNQNFQAPSVLAAGVNKTAGLDAMIRAYNKYHVALTPALTAAVRINAGPGINKRAGNDFGYVGATPPPVGYDLEFITPVQIGTPAQTVNMVLDTGSSDLWVMSSDTPKGQTNGQAIYRPGQSKTATRVAGASWNIAYGDGSTANGIVYRDTVRLGQVAVQRMAVQGAQSVSDSFTRDQYLSGIMGMGMSSGNTISPNKAQTFMDMAKGQLRQPVFTANLKKGRPGNYNFGFINKLEFTGNTIAWAKSDPNSIYWEINVSGYRVGSGPYQNKSWTALVDTGTTLLLLPDDMVRDYYAKVPGTRYEPAVAAFVFPCGAALPDFRFHINSYQGYVPGRYMNYGPVSQTYCYGGIQSSSGIGVSILGDILLKAQFVVFDLGNKRVGFANKKLES